MLFPYLMASFVGKMQDQAQRQYHRQQAGPFRNERPPQPDGKIRIDYVPPKASKTPSGINGKAGEFVDFEEIK